MPRVSKERQEKTLETMRENRKADTMFLRNIISKKLQYELSAINGQIYKTASINKNVVSFRGSTQKILKHYERAIYPIFLI